MYKAIQARPWKALYRMAASLEIASYILCGKAFVLFSVVLCQTFACPTDSSGLTSPVALPWVPGSPRLCEDLCRTLLQSCFLVSFLGFIARLNFSLDKTSGIAHRHELPSPTHPWRALLTVTSLSESFLWTI